MSVKTSDIVGARIRDLLTFNWRTGKRCPCVSHTACRIRACLQNVLLRKRIVYDGKLHLNAFLTKKLFAHHAIQCQIA